MIKKPKKLCVRLTDEMYDGLKAFIPGPTTTNIILPGVWNWTDLVLFSLRQVLEYYKPTPIEEASDKSTAPPLSDKRTGVRSNCGKYKAPGKSAAVTRAQPATKASGSKTRRKKVK